MCANELLLTPKTSTTQILYTRYNLLMDGPHSAHLFGSKKLLSGSMKLMPPPPFPPLSRLRAAATDGSSFFLRALCGALARGVVCAVPPREAAGVDTRSLPHIDAMPRAPGCCFTLLQEPTTNFCFWKKKRRRAGVDVQAMREGTSEPAGVSAGAGGERKEEEAVEDDSIPPTHSSSRRTGGGGAVGERGGVPHDGYLQSNAGANTHTHTHTQHNPVRPVPWGAERQERAQGNPAAKGAGGLGGDSLSSGGWQSAAGVREVGQHMSSNVQRFFPFFPVRYMTYSPHVHAHVVTHAHRCV